MLAGSAMVLVKFMSAVVPTFPLWIVIMKEINSLLGVRSDCLDDEDEDGICDSVDDCVGMTHWHLQWPW